MEETRTALRRPTGEDWDLWRSRLFDRYKSQQATARLLSQELRDKGYNVTIKMLRDRLRVWQVEPKYRKAKADHDLQPGSPSKPPTRREFNPRQRRLLSEIGRCFDLSWQKRIDQSSTVASVDLGSKINDFSNAAVIAINTGRPRAWGVLRQLVGEIEQTDLSAVDSFDPIDAPYYHLVRTSTSHKATEMKSQQAHFILTTLLTQKLEATHPHVKFLKESLRGGLTGELCSAIMQMDEGKTLANAQQHHVRATHVARSRLRLAWILLDLQAYHIVDSALAICESDDGRSNLSDEIRRRIFHILGKSRHTQGQLHQANHFFQLANSFEGKEMLGRTFELHWDHARCLLDLEDVANANAVLLQLASVIRAADPFDGDLDTEILAHNIGCVCEEISSLPAMDTCRWELVALKPMFD